MWKPFAAIAFVAVLLAGSACVLMHCVSPATGDATLAGASRDAAEPASGAARGNYDAAMSGVCRFSCATREPYREADLAAQPGAKSGDLTRCPVSGEVFRVDDKHPRVVLAGRDYVFCCDDCVTRFRADPAHYVSL